MEASLNFLLAFSLLLIAANAIDLRLSILKILFYILLKLNCSLEMVGVMNA